MNLHPDHASRPLHLGPDWKVPRFDTFPFGSFEEDEVKEIVEKIKRAGIEVEGTTSEAFDITEEWNKEVFYCVTAHAIESGDFSECREMFGDECVDDLMGYGFEDEYECECGECW